MSRVGSRYRKREVAAPRVRNDRQNRQTHGAGGSSRTIGEGEFAVGEVDKLSTTPATLRVSSWPAHRR